MPHPETGIPTQAPPHVLPPDDPASRWAERLAALPPRQLSGPEIEAFTRVLVEAVGADDASPFLNHLDLKPAQYVGVGSLWEDTFRRIVQEANDGKLEGGRGVRDVFVAAITIAPGNPPLIRFGERLAKLTPHREGAVDAHRSEQRNRWIGRLAAALVALTGVVGYVVWRQFAPPEQILVGSYDCSVEGRAMKGCAVRESNEGQRFQIDLPDSDDQAIVVQYKGPLEPTRRADRVCVRVALRQRLLKDVGAAEERPGGSLDLCQSRGGEWEGTWELPDSGPTKSFRMAPAASPSR
jgi:hypothetical protein